MNVRKKLKKIKQIRSELGIGKHSFPTFLVNENSIGGGIIIRLIDKIDNKHYKRYINEIYASYMLIFKENDRYKYYDSDLNYIGDYIPTTLENYILYLNMYRGQIRVKIKRKERKKLKIKYNIITGDYYLK